MMTSPWGETDFDRSVELALAALAEAEQPAPAAEHQPHHPCELLDAAGWPGEITQESSAA